ncbi:MAG TPA: glycosyltransferase family 4 protein [Verrucomicrobiae bacterium]|nr:glycosyltransferase family 4 protein [Verrucomicrobiae bacterium]
MTSLRIKQVLERWLPPVGRKASVRVSATRLEPAASPPPETRVDSAMETHPPEAQSSPLCGKNAVVVLFSTFPSDPRPRRAAEALVREGMKVEVVCLRHDASEPAREKSGGVDILRLPLKHHRGSKLGYVFRYLAFILWSGWILAVRSVTRRYVLVHVHNMPDILAFSALVPKLRGARVILDLHDPMPELMSTIYRSGRESRSVRLLQRLERWSIGFADVAVTVNLACQKIFTARSCPAEKLHVVMNAPDEDVFGFRPAVCREKVVGNAPFVIMYHGSVIQRHGLDLAVRALEIVRRTIPAATLKIYGHQTPFLEQVMKSVEKTDLAPAVQYLGGKSVEEIARAIDDCDVGIIPNRRSVFTEINTPTRIFEYLARGKPVIAPNAGGIADYFGEDQIIFFELGDAEDLARKIEFAALEPTEVWNRVRRGQGVYVAHTWRGERGKFLDLVRKLVLAERR